MADGAAMADRDPRSPGHGGRADRHVFHSVRGPGAGGAAGLAAAGDGRPHGIRRAGLFLLRLARSEVALHLVAGAGAHHRRLAGAGDVAAGARLHPAVAGDLRDVLLRQDHDRALFRDPDRVSQRHADRLPLLPRRPDPAPFARRRSNAAARARRGRRGAAAVDRKRRDLQDLAGRPAVTRPLRQRRERARRSGARRLRRSRTGHRAAARAQRRRDAAGFDAVGVRAGQRRGVRS